MNASAHLRTTQLEAALPELRAAPRDFGTLQLIIRRPAENDREELLVAELSREEGLVGDNWVRGAAHPDCQVTVMNSRAAQLMAQSRDRWALAGDQLYVDFDLSVAHLPPGARIVIGEEAVMEVTNEPHTGCEKFVSRFGRDAMQFVNSPVGRALNLRGINTRVLQPGTIRRGDWVRRVS